MNTLKEEPTCLLSCAHFCLRGYLLQDKSFYSDVSRLLPASVIVYSKPAVHCLSNIYRPPFDLQNTSSIQRNADQLACLFNESLSYISTRYSKILLSLSGGLDSRSILASFMTHKIPFQAVTFLDASKHLMPDVVAT